MDLIGDPDCAHSWEAKISSVATELRVCSKCGRHEVLDKWSDQYRGDWIKQADREH